MTLAKPVQFWSLAFSALNKFNGRYFSFWSTQSDCSLVVLFQKSLFKNDKEGFWPKNISMDKRGYGILSKI